MENASEAAAEAKLVRALGVPALTANIVNSTIGAGIFVLPALVAKDLGPAAPLAFLICALAMVIFVTCFAVAGSRVPLTGGLYAYVEVAFGRYAGYLAGILYAITAISAVAGVGNVLVDSIAGLIPSLGNPVIRVVLMFLVYAFLAVINIRSVRSGAAAVGVVARATGSVAIAVGGPIADCCVSLHAVSRSASVRIGMSRRSTNVFMPVL